MRGNTARYLTDWKNMAVRRFIVERIRFHLKETDRLVFTGWFHPAGKGACELVAYQNKKAAKLTVFTKKGADVRQKYIANAYEINEELTGTVTLPEQGKASGRLALFCVTGEKIFSVSSKELKRLKKRVEYYIESVKITDKSLELTGWAAGEKEVALSVADKDGRDVPFACTRYYRRDLCGAFYELDETQKPGFKISVPLSGENAKKEAVRLCLRMEDGEKRSVYRVNPGDGTDGLTHKWFDKTYKYLTRNGMRETIKKIYRKIGKKEAFPYEEWRKRHETPPETLREQREKQLPNQIFFSVVIPAYRTNPEYLRQMINSVRNQTWKNWELLIADGSGIDSPLTELLKQYAKEDERIHFKTLEENKGIAGNTNEALSMASGEVIVLADHDDLLPPEALFELAAVWNKDPSVDVVYTDEDKVSMDGKKYFDPHFKSDFNIDLLCSMNYICHLFAFRKEILQKAGGFRSEYDGAQDYDFILRCVEQAEKIFHIPKILYHWRCHIDSTAANPDSKRYAFEAGRRAIEAHYQRLGIPARAEHGEFYGMYRTIYEWRKEPLVSVLIPNKDHTDDLEKCLASIRKSDYPNYEVIIIENNSTEAATFDYYKKIASDRIKVVTYRGAFNFSAVNNFGASHAAGDYFLLLNNDTEMQETDCIRELLGYCMRDDVGAVGARLYYEDDTIQHAGVVLGFGGIAGHTFIGKSGYDTGYFGRIICAQDYSAVTAACMMTKRTVFEEVGGLSEDLRVAFNDIDYCMKVRETGKLIVYNPYAKLYHYESKSRGLEDTPEKVERFNGEIELFRQKWEKELSKGDPYYNPNLTLSDSDFSLRKA